MPRAVSAVIAAGALLLPLPCRMAPAQPVVTTSVTRTLQDEPQAASPQDPVPVLPELVIPGRPDAFPANPLDPDAVISATRTETRSGEVGSSLTVITGRQIAESHQSHVAEVLRDVAGLDVARQGGPGGLTSVFLRGANSQHTKVLLDGIPLNDPSNAGRSFDFSTLTVDNIERIEVLRGPQSVLYGSDAIGGVINIVTVRGDGPVTVRAGGMGGSFGTGRASIQASGGGTHGYFSLAGSYFDTAGISAASEHRGFTERDGLNNAAASGRVGWTPSDLVNVDFVFRYGNSDAEVDDFDFVSGRPVDNLVRRNVAQTYFSRLELQSTALAGTVDQRIGFNFADYDRRDTDPEPFVPVQFDGQSRQLDYQADLLLAERNVLTAGASYLVEDASSSFASQVSQNNVGVFVQDQFQVGERWFATAGFRWDDHSAAGPASTWRLTNLIRFDETGTSFHGTIGTGFRAPALAENLFQFGNPNLRPERSKGWDAGVEQWLVPETLMVDATVFRNDFSDLIVFDFNTFLLENVGRARATGLELSAVWHPWRATTLGGNYTLTDTRNLADGQRLLRRPRDKAGLFIEQRFQCDRARVRLSALYVGDRLDTRRAVLDEYFLVSLSGDWDIRDDWSVFARIDNLLDQRYEEVFGYGVPGISGYAGINYAY